MNDAVLLRRSTATCSALSQKLPHVSALQRGVAKKTKKEPTAAEAATAREIIAGRVLPDAALVNKITALVAPASAKDIPKPPCAPLVDYLHISPEPNLETVDIDSLKKHKIVVLREYGDGSGCE